MASRSKSDQAFRTIGELAAELRLPQHILRYWETRFPQLKPLQRAGNRRYYRPADVDLARTIHRLLNSEGYTVRGVQKVLRSKDTPAEPTTVAVGDATVAIEPQRHAGNGVDVSRLKAVRQQLAALLED